MVWEEESNSRLKENKNKIMYFLFIVPPGFSWKISTSYSTALAIWS
jgi:hypothetical protein